MHDEYRSIVDLVREECDLQLARAGLPAGLAEDLLSRKVLFGEHPEALIVLPVVMYRALGGGNAEDVAPVAAAMEFLLAAADILDDVQDLALPEHARSGDRVHSHYINEVELLTTLLLLAEQSVISLLNTRLDPRRVGSVIARFNTFKVKAFNGQYADVHGNVGISRDIEDSLRITFGKSGSLGRCAGELGAILATSNSTVIEAAGSYGEHLAVARQFHDDVANLWPRTGRLDDLEQLKSTLPFTFALTHSGNGHHATPSLESLVPLDDLVALPVNGTSRVRRDLSSARDEVFKGGGIHFGLLQSIIHLVKARSIGRRLEKLPPGEGLLEHLASA